MWFSSCYVQIFSSLVPSIYVRLVCETKFHIHVKQQVKLSLKSLGHGKTKDTETNGSERFQNGMCSQFLHECNFDLLLLFPHI
jgi:hypothetical protein